MGVNLYTKCLNELRSSDKGRLKAAATAYLILVQDGTAGMTEMARLAHVSVTVVRTMANVGKFISVETREKFSEQPWANFVAVVHAKRHFPAGDPQADPAFWLAQAQEHGWTRNHLREAYQYAHTRVREGTLNQITDAAMLEALRNRKMVGAINNLAQHVSRVNAEYSEELGVLFTLRKVKVGQQSKQAG